MTAEPRPSARPVPSEQHSAADSVRRTLLADERTYLAWSRTGLTAFAVAIGVGAIVPAVAGGADYLYVAVGLGYSLLGMAFFAYGLWRLRAVSEAVQHGEYVQPDTRLATALTGFGVILGVTTMGVLVYQVSTA